MSTYISGEEAVKIIKSCNRVFVQGGAATPHHLIDKMVERADELRDVELVFMSLQGKVTFTEKKYRENFRTNSVFVSANVRDAVNDGRGDYIPIFLSEVPNLFRSPAFPIDVALVQVSPPDKHGFCSLGTSIDITATAVKYAKYVIAQVNPRVPRTFGDGILHISAFNALVEFEQELPEIINEQPSEITMRIGQ